MTDDRFDVNGDGSYLATTTITSFRILEALERYDGITVSELVDELGLASGTIYKHLNTLQRIQYVNKDGHEYRLGLGFLELGITARMQANVYEQTLDSLSNLAETTGSVTTLMVPEHGYGIYLTQIVPEDAASPPHQEGERVHLHATAGGKAILAYQPDEMVDAWVTEHELRPLTDETITDADRFRSELQSVRDRRTAHERGEHFEGWHSVAAPLTDESEEAIGAVSLEGPIESEQNSIGMTEVRNILGSIVGSMENKLRLG